jgi:hypothetical protein
MTRSSIVLMALYVGCAHPAELQQAPTTDTRPDRALEIETVAIGSMLRQSGLVGSANGWIVVIDSAFAHAGHAPGGATGTIRAARRHDALVKSVVMDQPTSGDTLRVRASDPTISGDSATISVTIGYRRQHPERRRRAGYQTDEIGLRRTQNGWVVTRRTNLGIT